MSATNSRMVPLVTWDTVGKLVVPLLGFFGVWLQVHRSYGGTRKRIKEDLELLALLPEASEAREPLSRHVDDSIRKILEDENERRRDPTGMVLALVFLGIAAFLSVLAVQSGGWWWWLLVPAAIFFIFGAVGLVQDGVRRKRDERGRPIE